MNGNDADANRRDEAIMQSMMHESEFRVLSRLALPLMGAQLAQMLMGVVDTVMAGRISAVDLQACWIGGTLHQRTGSPSVGVDADALRRGISALRCNAGDGHRRPAPLQRYARGSASVARRRLVRRSVGVSVVTHDGRGHYLLANPGDGVPGDGYRELAWVI